MIDGTGAPAYGPADIVIRGNRIAEIRLGDKFGVVPALGNLVWDWAEVLAVHSDPGFAERGELTVTYLTDAHRACAQQLAYLSFGFAFDDAAAHVAVCIERLIGESCHGPVNQR